MQPGRGEKSISRAGEASPGKTASAGTRFQSSFDQIAVGIAHTTTDGRILEVNRKLCELLGYTATELSALTTRELTHPDDRDQQDSMRQQLLDGSRSHFSGDKRYLRKNGSVIWVTRTVALAREHPGSEPYLIQTIDSIAERKGTELELKNSLSLLQATLESTADGILVLNGVGRVMSYNRRFVEMWQLPDALMEKHNGHGLLDHVRAQLADPKRFSARVHDLCTHPEASSDHVILFNDGRVFERYSRPQSIDGEIVGRVWSFRDVTARKELERRLAMIFSHAAVGMALTDLDSRYLMVNQHFADMLGYAPAEMIGLSVNDTVVPAEDRAAINSSRNKLMRGELDKFTAERRYTRKDGDQLWANHTISTVRDASGTPQYFIRVVEDITGRKEADERYRATVDNAPMGILHTAIESYQILRVNPKLCTMFGYTEDELLRMTSTEIVHPDFRFIDRPKYHNLARSGNAPAFSSERKFVRKDGSVFWGNRTVSMVRDTSGKPLYHIRIIEDITERKRVEDMITRERALLRTIIDAIPDHIYAKDTTGHFTLANKAWLDARGEKNEDITGKTSHDYFRPKLAESLTAQDREIIQTGHPIPSFEHKLAIERRDGQADEVRWGTTVKVPLRTAAGEIIGTIGITRDITDQKNAATRRAMSLAVTRALAESSTVSEAMPRIIRTICETMGWTYGARWAQDDLEERLNRIDYWCAFEPEFDPADRHLWLSVPYSGTGRFLRRVWVDNSEAWITNLHDAQPFRRKASVLKLGWRCAYAFPIRIGNRVDGVMEFFGTEVREPDEHMVQSTVSVGSQIGQFIQRKEAEDKVAFLAQFDAITDLPNRFLFSDRLGQLLAQAQRNHWSVGTLFVDLDRFKLVNDTYGHAAGDELLRLVATRMKTCVRSDDTVARLSGDEFAVMLANLAKTEDAGRVAQKIVEALAAPFDLGGRQTYISASIGIAIYPGDGGDADALLKNADTAMYRAKEQGRNGYQFYLPEMNERLILRQKIDAQLHGALERREFLLHYQPKVSLATGAITGFETLLRWQRGEALIPPADFISILEETSLIVPVGEWILDTVCAQLKQWEHDGITPRPVAINLSARQFQRKNLAEVVAQTLRNHGIKPALLKLELTESLLMSDAKESIETLHQLKHIGVQLSVDDFGTGYSSLAYLKRFPLDELKIDREFIRDAISDPDDAAITLSIINLAHTLKLRVVAEGVESEGQINFLRQHGCDEIQGYYFSRPVAVAACTSMLAADKRLHLLQRNADRNVMTMLLVVERETELLRLTQAFAPDGFQVLTARNTDEGFEILARQRVDILISDNDMPGMGGIEFLGRVRKLYANTLRVLASSGDDTPSLSRATNRAGIHLFLPKDWPQERLCAEVRETVQTHAYAATATGKDRGLDNGH